MRAEPSLPHTNPAGGLVLAWAALALAGCSPDHPGATLFELADASVYAGHPGTAKSRAFDVIAADMDVDGDPDLLVNWHHLAPMELYENEGGRFRRVNAPGSDRSGLYDLQDVVQLFVDSADMRPRIEQAERSGLYVWHDVDRRGSWRLYWKSRGQDVTSFVLELTTALSFEGIEGLDDAEVTATGEYTRQITVRRDPGDFEFAVKTEQVSSCLGLELRSSAGARLPVVVGQGLLEFGGGEVVLWKPDPHGMAWADVEGTPSPELYITRGGMKGELVAPRPPKLDRYYTGGPAGGPWFVRASVDTVPYDWGRGRGVEWIDVDNDGRLEVAVSNKNTPNKLLQRGDDGGPFKDIAGDYGIDLEGPEVQSWGDYDGDGWQDLLNFLEGHTVDILRNRGGGAFERLSGAALGLEIPSTDPLSTRPFDFAALRQVDFDSDGDLDMWVLMFGEERTNHLFLREGDRFTRVSERVGLNAVRGDITVVLCDFDNDGFEDAFSTGTLNGEDHHGLLWHNRGGAEFSIGAIAALPRPVHIATNLDADGDGRWDIACMGTDRYLLRNVAVDNGWVEIALRDRGREPVGALVKAHYADGRVVARRYGSAYNSAYSQALRPLRFGVKAGGRIERVTVRWPGEQEEQAYEPPGPGQTKILERR